MKNHTQLYYSLFFILVLLSCNRKDKTESVEVTKMEPIQTVTDTAEFDPYFWKSPTYESLYGPASITRNILQDKKGTIWLATFEGIIKYDGKTFTNITNKEGLRPFRVFSLFEDSAGNIWFGTIGAGLYRYDGKSFTNFTTEDGLVNDKIGCIMEDSNGVLWIGTMNGISNYDGTTFNNFTIDGGALNNDINAIVEDDSQKLWIGTRGKAYTYNGQTFTKITTDKEKALTNVRTIVRDEEGPIWLGGHNGLWSYNGSIFSNRATNFTGYIYQDRQGNMWTNSAADDNSRNWVLSKYDKKSTATPVQIKVEENMFFGITEDTKGGIWLGTLRGVYRYDGTTFKGFAAPQVPFE